MCRITIFLLAIFVSVTTAAGIAGQVEVVDDRYYPTEEKAERDGIVWPILIELRPDGVVLQTPSDVKKEVQIGQRYDQWEVVAVLPGSEPVAVLERNFTRWGLIAYIGKNGPIAKIRKAVGRLDALQKERAFSKEHFDQILNAKKDVLAKDVLSSRKDPSYESMVGLLPPLKTYTFLGTISARRKLAVLPDGRMGYLKTSPYNKARGLETVYFDPWKHFTGKNIPGRDSVDLAGKQGLLGGYLPAVNFGFHDSNKKWGWEQTGFAVESSDHSSGMDAFVCLRSTSGERIYERVFSSEKLDSAIFYGELLALKQKWDSFFDKGMKVHTADTRAIDAGRAAIIRGLITYIELEPRYGLGHYWNKTHNTFPPTNYFMNTALLEWGFKDEAKERLGYYLSHYINDDGTFRYYGPAVAEYGELLALVARCVQLDGDDNWFLSHLPKLDLITERLLAELKESRTKHDPGSNQYGLLYGSPEADTREDTRFWFSGSIWCWRGLKEIGKVESDLGEKTANSTLKQQGEELRREAAILHKHITASLERSMMTNAGEPFLPPCIDYDGLPFEKMTESTFSNYTNYRYWLEMLSGGLMNDPMNNAIIDYRRDYGGELLGMIRFGDSADNWPYCHFAWGLMDAKQRKQYQLGFYAHLAHHQTRGTFNAYEQVKIAGTKESDYSERTYGAHYCVPSQVVAPIALKWMLVWEDLDSEQVWLAEAVPQSWFNKGFMIEDAPTRWGEIGLTISPGGKTGQIELAKTIANIKIHLYAPQLTSLSINGKHVDFARNGDYVEYDL